MTALRNADLMKVQHVLSASLPLLEKSCISDNIQ